MVKISNKRYVVHHPCITLIQNTLWQEPQVDDIICHISNYMKYKWNVPQNILNIVVHLTQTLLGDTTWVDKQHTPTYRFITRHPR